MDLAILHQKNSGCLSCDPKVGMAVLEKLDDRAALQSGCIPFIECRELDAIEARETIACSHPEIAIPGLSDGDDRTLRWMYSGIGVPDIYGEVLGFAPGAKATHVKAKQKGWEEPTAPG